MASTAFTKMVLVPQTSYNSMIENRNIGATIGQKEYEETDPMIFQLIRLNNDMSSVLNNKLLPADVKLLQFDHTFSKYLDLKKQQNLQRNIVKTSIPMESRAVGSDEPLPIDDNDSNDNRDQHTYIKDNGNNNNGQRHLSVSPIPPFSTPVTDTNTSRGAPSSSSSASSSPSDTPFLPKTKNFGVQSKPVNREKGQKLLKFVKNNYGNFLHNENKELIVNGKPIRSSNILNLINDFSRMSKKKPLSGSQEFAQMLISSKVPRDLIGNTTRLKTYFTPEKVIEATPKNPRHRKRVSQSQSGSGIIKKKKPDTPFKISWW